MYWLVILCTLGVGEGGVIKMLLLTQYLLESHNEWSN